MNKEILEKVSKCKTAEEVLELAKSNGKNISKDQAKKLFDTTHANGELTDEEVSNVSGAGCNDDRHSYEKVFFKTREEAERNYIFHIGQNVEWFPYNTGNCTTNCNITKRKAEYSDNHHAYYDAYETSCHVNKFFDRTRFEK